MKKKKYQVILLAKYTRMKQKAKDHHYVPQCYLKPFTINKQLFALDVRKVQKGYKELPIRRSTAQTCYFKDYYTIGEEMGEPQFRLNAYEALYIEVKVLSRLENLYGDIHGKLISNRAISLNDAINLSDFIIQLKLRNPYWLKETLEKKKDSFIDSAMDIIVTDKLDSNAQFKHMPMQLKAAVAEWIRAENKQNPKFSKQMQLFSLIQRNNHEETRNEKFRLALVDCKWMVYEAPENGPYFVTSDNPGYSLKANDGLTYNTNFTNPFMFFFPLSPTRCLVISSHEKDFSYTQKTKQKVFKSGTISGDLVISINNTTMQCINSLLIAADSWYLSQIAEINKPKK